MPVPLSPVAVRSWQLLADRAAGEPDPRVRANLAMVAKHVEEEVRGDIPALMATLVPEPRYTVWGASDSAGPQGGAQVRSFYEASIATGKNRLEFDITRVIADRDTVVTEGVFRHAYAGDLLMDRGLAPTGSLEADGWYLVEYQALVVWPMSDDGLIEGEAIYAGEPPRIFRLLAPGECPHLGPPDRASPTPGGLI